MFDSLDLLAATKVLDLGIWRPAPFAAQLLAELGAEVVKIEPPGGDPMRSFSTLYESLNDRKSVVELDLKDPGDRTRALELAEGCEVVVEGFRPGVADRLGVGFDALSRRHPGVVYCSLTGFGQDGPLSDAPGHDLNYQAWSGVLAARAPNLGSGGIPIADLAGGVYAALSICAALIRRGRTGLGVHIDVAMTDVLSTWAGPAIDGALASGADPSANFPAYGTFDCVDGAVTLAVVTEEPFWQSLCEVLDLAHLADLDATDRASRGPRLRAEIAAAIAPLERAALVGELLDAGVPVAPVLDIGEAARTDQARARGTVGLDDEGTVRFGHPVRFS